MWVTIIADASFCPETGVAGYGFWIASERGKTGSDGVLKSKCINSSSAEMKALMTGLHLALRSGLLEQGDSVLMQTDCQSAIQAFQNKRISITEQERENVDWFQTFKKSHALTVRFKHVKGHTRKSDARYVVNQICDRKARRNMRKARDELRNENE